MERHPVFLVSVVIHRAEVQRKYLVGKQALCHKFVSPLLSSACIASRQEAGSSLTHSSSLPWEPSVPFINSFLMPGNKGLVFQIPAEVMHWPGHEIQHLSCMFPPPEKQFTTLLPRNFNAQTTCQRRTLHTHPMCTESRMNPLTDMLLHDMSLLLLPRNIASEGIQGHLAQKRDISQTHAWFFLELQLTLQKAELILAKLK